MGFLDNVAKGVGKLSIESNLSEEEKILRQKQKEEEKQRKEEEKQRKEEEKRIKNEERKQREEERKKKLAEIEEKLRRISSRVIVSTGGLSVDYEIIQPISFKLSNDDYTTYLKKYAEDIKGFLKEYEYDIVGGSEIERGFFIATEELKRKAALLGADAVIYFNEKPIVYNLNPLGDIYELIFTGTAVKIKKDIKDKEINN